MNTLPEHPLLVPCFLWGLLSHNDAYSRCESELSVDVKPRAEILPIIPVPGCFFVGSASCPCWGLFVFACDNNMPSLRQVLNLYHFWMKTIFLNLYLIMYYPDLKVCLFFATGLPRVLKAGLAIIIDCTAIQYQRRNAYISAATSLQPQPIWKIFSWIGKYSRSSRP